METIARSTPLSLSLLVLFSLGSFFFRLGELPLTGADEPRYARIAEEMQREGRWVTPLLEGKPWLEKPPFYYWITIPVVALRGPGEATSRLGPALCALGTVLAVFWLGRRLWGPLAGTYSGMILATCLGFAGFARSASTDMPFSLCLTLGLLLLMLAIVDPSASRTWLWIAYVLLGLSILAKGPIGLVLAIGICALFWWLDDRGGSIRRLHPLLGAAILALVSFPWFWMAYRENGYAFVSIFLINHNLARYVAGIHHHVEPFYYYLPVLLGLMFPWSGWFGILVPDRLRRETQRPGRSDRGSIFLVCWAVFPILFFSISASKLAGYVLPCLPPLALLLGIRAAELENRSEEKLRFSGFYLALCLSVAGALPLFFERRYGGHWEVGLWLGVIVAAPAVWAFVGALRGRLGSAFRVTILQGWMLVIGTTYLAFPVLASYHSTRQIAQEAMQVVGAGEPIVTYRFFHHTLLYYSGYRVLPQLLDSRALAEFAREHPRFLLVTEAIRLDEVYKLQGFTVNELARQGKLRLLRLAHS